MTIEAAVAVALGLDADCRAARRREPLPRSRQNLLRLLDGLDEELGTHPASIYLITVRSLLAVTDLPTHTFGDQIAEVLIAARDVVEHVARAAGGGAYRSPA